MKVQKLRWAGLAVALAAIANQAAWADGDRPSQQTLDEMGLGGLVAMSDDDAMQVRGQGFKNGSSVAVFGNSFATINSPFGTAHSENGYAADGKHFAFGKNFSHAGVEIKKADGHGRKGDKPWRKAQCKVWRGKPDGHMGGKMRGHMGGKMRDHRGGGHSKGGHPKGRVPIKSIRVFAGGHSFAVAR